ncbi:MAG TPA: thermonuclease family protein [Magnetospirillaceae bacterium]|jgi:endonuclease YncB( thermonuclease family)
MAPRLLTLTALIVLCTAPAMAAPIDVSLLVDLGVASIAKIDDRGAITLNDGRTLRLSGIELTQGRASQDLQATLTELVGHDPIALKSDGPEQDRYGRLVAQVFTADGTWIEGALLRKGLARVATTPDHAGMAAALYAAERSARGHHLGLWSDPRTALRHADDVMRFIDSWQVVDGTVISVSPHYGAVDLRLGDDEHRDLSIRVPTAIADAMDTDPADLVGRHLRVRGWIGKGVGPLIVLNHAEQIELVGRSRRPMTEDP